MSCHLIDCVCVDVCPDAYVFIQSAEALTYARISDWITLELLWRKMVANHLPECLWENRHFVGVSAATWLNLHAITPQQTCNPIYELITSPGQAHAHSQVTVKM